MGATEIVETKKLEAVRLHKKGLRPTEIAVKVDLSKTTVLRHFRKMGLTLPPRTYGDVEKARRELRGSPDLFGETMDTLVKRYGVSSFTIGKLRKEARENDTVPPTKMFSLMVGWERPEGIDEVLAEIKKRRAA